MFVDGPLPLPYPWLWLPIAPARSSGKDRPGGGPNAMGCDVNASMPGGGNRPLDMGWLRLGEDIRADMMAGSLNG